MGLTDEEINTFIYKIKNIILLITNLINNF